MTPCRIGITIDPIDREQERKETHPTLRHWRVVTMFGQRSLAESAAQFLSEQFDCDFESEGGPEHATWYLYRFNF